MKKLLFTLFSLAIIGIACLSCKIGLGQAVDTQPPEVKIITPEVGAVIRDAFIIGGTWTDDGSIKSEGGLLVSLERTDDSGEKVDYYGKVGDGDWSCVIDPLNNIIPLRDGEYQATITMTDTYEHETVKTVTFTIDNTAPIVVLQRPSAKIGSSSPDSYGQSFTLEGQSADDSNINSIEVFIYEDEDCSVLKHTVTLNNVPPTIELDVAKFIENEENDYAKIYGSTTRSGTRQFYCKMIAYDGAQRYPIDGTGQTEADKKGNATDHYYLYEEISAPILNDYKITEVYHMLNGNYTGGDSSSRAATISSVQETLSENKITTGFFSLNPANNPTFVVSGRNTLTKDGTDFDTEHVTNWEISSGTKVQVEVSTGLDGIPLEGDSLGVYVIECDAKGEPKDGAEKISIISPKTELSDDAAIAERESLIAKSGTSYKFTTALDASKTPALQFNHSYIFGIYGKDQKGNEVTDFGNSYGFYFIPSGAAPVITVTSPSNTVTYLHKGQSQIFAGTAEVEDSVPVISLYNGDTLIASTSLTEADATILESGKRLYSFNFEVPATGTNSFNQSTSAQYNYTILATKGGVSSSIAKTIMYDVDPPQVSLITIEPKAACYPDESGNSDGYEYLNGNIKIKVTVTDEFDTVDASKPNKYEFIQNGEVKISGSIDSFPTKEITNIDTTLLTDKSDVELVITAYDRAGNELKTSQTHKVTIGTNTDNRAHEDSFGTNLIFKVNQETDRPYIIPGTKTTFTKKVADDLDTSTAANPNGYNIFSSGQQLIVKCIDDDGLGEVKVYKEKYDSLTGQLIKDGNNNPVLEEHTGKGKNYGGTTKEESFSYYLPEKAGIHYLNIKVTDKNGKEKETGTFIFKITAGYPVIEKVSSNRNYSNGAADRKFDNTIKINSDQGPFKVFRSTSNNFDLEHDTPIYTTGETETEWTDEGLNPQTTTKYYYCVQDKNLHESNIASIECKVEKAAPETLTITSPVNDLRTGTNSITDTNFTFGGNATDKDSGVKYIYYCFRTTDAAPTQLSDYTKMDASNGSWSVSKTLNQGTSAASAGNLYEGKWYLFVKAEDEAGNISATAVRREFEVDMLMPVTQFTGTVPEKVKEAFTVTGTSSDTHGLALVKLTDEKSSYTKTLTVDGNNAWSQEVTLGTGGLADGEHILVVTGKDLSGKTTTEKKTVFVDTKAPEIDASVTVPKGTDFDYADVEFRGKVTDASPSSGVKYVKFYIANGTDPSASGYQKTPELTADGTNTWSKSIKHANYPAIFGTNQGVKYVYIYSEDEAGNKSPEVCKEIVYDTENPVLSELKYKVNSVSKDVSNGDSVIIGKNSFELSGNFNDTVSNVTVEVARGSQSQTVTQNPTTGKSGTWTVSQTSILDGVYKYQVQAKDASGRTSDSSEISIRVDTTAPKVKTIQTPSVYDTQNTSISFNGTASDDNGSGIEEVYLGFAPKTADTDLTDTDKFVVVNGTDNWYYTVDTSTKFTTVWSTSGDKTVYVYTKDKAGNISAVKTAGFIYDKRSPTLDTLKYKGTTGSAITLQADNAGKYSFFLGELFTLDVTYSDDWGVDEDSITYTEKKDDGTPSAAKALTSTTKLPEQGTANNKPATGKYEYQIKITDKAGKSITKQLTVQVDVTAPTITITSPSSTASGDASLKGTDYSFQGDVSDTGYSGLKAYYYAITTSPTAPTDTTKWTEVAQTSNGLWTRKLNLMNGTGTNNATDLYEGHYYLHVKAIDNAGNLTAAATTREFYVDQAAPVISEVGYKDGTDAKITIAEGRTYYKSTNGSVTFSGKVTDTYGVKSLKLNGNDVTVSTTDGSWSESVTMTADTDITLALVATDKAGRKTEQTYILHRDTKDPSVEITNPDSDIKGVNSLSASTYTFRGPVSDSGSGILTYKYVLTSTPIAGAEASNIEAANATAKKIADGETPTQAELNAAEAVKQAIITSATAATNTAGWVTGTAKDGFSETRTLKDGNGTNTSSNIYEGQQYIYLYAEDKVGNKTAIGRSYWVDKKNPDLDENEVGAAGKQLKKDGSQTLKGTVSDANGIKSLQIIDDLSDNVWDVTSIDDSGNWSITIAAGSGSDKLCDGEHSLTVKAVDNADKATEKTRSVSVDTIAPDSTGIYFNAIPDWEDEAHSRSWFKNANVPIKVTGVKDDKSTATAKAKAYASGVAAVEYSTDGGANWVSMIEDVNNTWIATAYCNTQGQNTIYARVKDAFGNYSTNKTISVYIDTEAPVSPTTNEYWVELKTLTAAEKTAETNGTKPKASATATKGLTGSLLTNNADAKRVMVELIVKDANSAGTLTSSGVKEVSLSYGTNGANKITAEKTKFTPAVAQGQASVEYDVYNLVLPPAAVKDGDCVITLTDNVGNTKEFKPFSFETDTTAPKIKINTINDADKETTGTQVNKKFNLAGTGSDNRQVKQLDVCYYYNNAWTNIYSTTTADDIFNWTKEIDTVKSATCTFGNTTDMDGKEVTFCVIITDEAGNRNLDTGSGSTLVDNTEVENGKLIPTQAPTSIAAANKATVKIDQDSDRPKITFTNVKLDGMTSSNSVYLTGTNTLYGLVEDDDGVKTLKYKKSGDATWTDVTVTNGSFNISNLAEGAGTYLFQIVESDLVGNETGLTYECTGTNVLKLIGSDKKKFETPLYLKVDVTNPTIKSIEAQPYSNATTTNGAVVDVAGNSFGGKTKNLVQFIIKGEDANGIKGGAIQLKQSSTVKTYRTATTITIDKISTWTGVSGSGSTTDGVYTWTTDQLDLKTLGFTEGEVTLTTYIVDNSGAVTNNEIKFTIDNTATALTISSPSKDGMTFYGIQSNTFGGSVTGAVDIEKIEYIITKSATAPTTGWIEATSGISTASIIFDGEKDKTDETKFAEGHNALLKGFLTAEEQNANNSCAYYLYFKTTDNCGNTATSKRSINIIPNGDVPTVTITTPTTNDKIAGSLRIFGSTSIYTSSVEGVYIQIDPNYDGTTFTTTWKSDLQAITHIYDEEIHEYISGKEGIKADGTNIFSLILNRENELNQDTERKCAIKVIAVSESGKESEAVIVPFSVDPNPPLISDIELVQLDTNGNVTKTMAYTSGMWVNGNWWLRFNAHDDSNIKTLTIGEVTTTTVTKKVVTNASTSGKDDMTNGNGTDKTIRTTNYSGTLGGKSRSGQTVIFPLATGTGQGSRQFVIKAVENTTNNFDAETTIKLNYDNNAPEISNTLHDDYKMDPNVQQTNGLYTLKGFAKDSSDGSGVARIAFYFLRRSRDARVFDPQVNNSFAKLSDLVYSDGLYWKKKTGVGRSAPEKIELSAKDDNIHAGGLVKIGAGIYKIETVSADGKTITINASPSTSITDVYFAMASVVEDKGTNLDVQSWTEDAANNGCQWSGSINSTNMPDGIIEIHYVVFDNAQNYSIGIVGNVKWDTYKAYPTDDAKAVKSLTPTNNSTPGTGEFIYAFDSDNPAFVSNNAPRIVSVTVGCDYNGNGLYSADEKTIKYAGEKDYYIHGKSVKRAEKVTNKFIASSGGATSGDDGWGIKEIKGKMQVEIEIIGGNGDIYLQHSIDGTTYKEHDEISSFNYYGGTTAAPILEEDDDRDTEGLVSSDVLNDKYYSGTTLKPIVFDEETLSAATTTGTGASAVKGSTTLEHPTWFTFEIWDSTEELTAFTDSQHAFLKLPVAIQVNDDIQPNTVFNDLYWNSNTDNSVYINPTTDALEGHVELKGYLGTNGIATTYGSDDDKVSGKVVFRGYAWDNKRLSKLRWGIASVKGNITTAQAWLQTYVEDVVFSNGTWTAKGDAGIGQPYYYFKVYDDEDHGAYLNGDGHKVYWELTVDTSYVQEPGKASTDDAWAVGKDLYVWVQATDTADKTTNMNPTEMTNGTDAQNIRPNYKVDVVPYVTGVKTRLGTKADDTRSASGRYQIASNETGIELTGYNLKQGSANLAITTPTTVGNYPCTITRGTGGSAVNFVAVNNINDNSAVGSTPEADKGKVKNKYNMQPSTYNQTLTDDVAFDVWQINNRAARTYDGVAFVQEPVMRYNPNNGNIGFAFSNGAARFSMPNGTSSSNTVWERNYASYTNNAMVFTSAGAAIGVSVGIDTQPSDGKAGRMSLYYSNWGTSQTNDQSGNFNNNTNAKRLDAIGTGGATIIERRFSSTSIAVAEHSSGNPYVYLAYYDIIDDDIKFRWGTVSGGTNNPTSSNQLVQSTNEGTKGFTLNGNYYSEIANGSTTAGTGEYLDIAVVPGTTYESDVVCAVWNSAGKLYYSYKRAPCNDYDMYKDNKYGTATANNGYWSQPQILLSNGGQYCKVEVDGNKGVHIAAYDQAKKGVAYIYLPTYSTTYSESTHYHLIDAMNGPYDEIGLDVAVTKVNTDSDATGKAIPSISYYSNGTPKMAVYTTGFTKNSAPEASWENDMFTGKWDVCYIPTNSKLLKDHICTALPKSGTGVWGTQNTGTSTFTTSRDSNTYRESGTVNDNKTNNPIIGYAIKNGSYGYMEIAQRKN